MAESIQTDTVPGVGTGIGVDKTSPVTVGLIKAGKVAVGVGDGFGVALG